MKKCKDCMHWREGHGSDPDAAWCDHPECGSPGRSRYHLGLGPLSPTKFTCQLAREMETLCGPAAKFFEPIVA